MRDSTKSVDQRSSTLEYYTTPHEPSLLSNLEKESGKQPTVVDRAFVEDGNRILRDARSSKVVLAVPGRPDDSHYAQ